MGGSQGGSYSAGLGDIDPLMDELTDGWRGGQVNFNSPTDTSSNETDFLSH
jgi:hypothetical protein